MIHFIVEYLEGPEGKFFFDIDFNTVPETIQVLNHELENMITNNEIKVQIKVKYIND